VKEPNIFEYLREPYYLPERIRLFEAFAGIGCQKMALDLLHQDPDLVDFEVETIGISEIDKFAIKSYNAMHGETKCFGDITKIHGIDVPQVDIMTYSFPCTDLSRAGKMSGMSKETRSGLVYEILRILKELRSLNRLPKVLIMENVVDLVQTKFIKEFQDIQYEIECFGYTNYVSVINARDQGVAQNRARVFMVSILGDYYYEFPSPIPLKKRLKDYLEPVVPDKYYLSQKSVEFFENHSREMREKGNGFSFDPKDGTEIADTILTKPGSRMDDNYVKDSVRIGGLYDDEEGRHQAGSIWHTDGVAPTIDTAQGGHRTPLVIQRSRSGNEIDVKEECPTITASRWEMNNMILEPKSCASRAREGIQSLEVNESGLSNALTTVQKDALIIEPIACQERVDEGLRTFSDNVMGTLRTTDSCGDKRVVEGMFTEEQAKMITEDGDIRRYLDSDVVDKFEVGDAADISFPNGYNKAKRVFKGYAPTINPTTTQANLIVKVEDDDKIKIIGNYSPSGYMATSIVDKDGIAPTVRENHGQVTAISEDPLVFDDYNQAIRSDQDTMGTITPNIGNDAPRNGYKLIEKKPNTRIRKLMPIECWRLMGIEDSYFYRAREVNSDAQLYKQAGNGIVVPVMAAIIKPMIRRVKK